MQREPPLSELRRDILAAVVMLAVITIGAALVHFLVL
jgi:hypothetical protein